jgi:hypothetical protein
MEIEGVKGEVALYHPHAAAQRYSHQLTWTTIELRGYA